MSIPALQQTAKELRRLAIAGSGLAKDDFRLAKLVPVLQKSGAKAPIFAKIASAVEELVAAESDATASSLLRVTTLVNAVLYTQLQNKVDGDFEPLPIHDVTLESRPSSAKALRAVIEALTTTGPGRLEVVQEAHNRGLFQDLRLLQPALRSFEDPYPDLAEFMRREVLPGYGRAILPLVQESFDPKGGSGHQRRLRLMLKLMTPDERHALCTELLNTGSPELRATALDGLEGAPAAKELIVEHLGDRAKDVRAAAYRALGTMDDVLEPLMEALGGKDADLAAVALGRHLAGRPDASAAEALVAYAEDYRAKVLDKKRGFHVRRLLDCYRALVRDPHGPGVGHLLEAYADRKGLGRLRPAVKADISGSDLVEEIADLLSRCGDDRATEALLADLDLSHPWPALEAALHTRDPAFVYDTFHPLLTGERSKRGTREQVAEYLLRHVRRRSVALDPRWLDAAILRNHRRLVFALKPRDHARAIAYLHNIARDWGDDDARPALEALAHTTYDDWAKLLAHRLKTYKGSGRRSWYSPWSTSCCGCSRFTRLTDDELQAAEGLTFEGSEELIDRYRSRLSEERFRRIEEKKNA